MNLLEKYKVLANRGERYKVKKGFIEELPVISASIPSVDSKTVEVSILQGAWKNTRENVENQSAISAKLPQEKKIVWQNPFPKGTPEARAESLRVVEAARRGEPISLRVSDCPAITTQSLADCTCDPVFKVRRPGQNGTTPLRGVPVCPPGTFNGGNEK